VVLPLALPPSVFLPQGVLALCECPTRAEAAAGKDHLAMEAGLNILQSVQFHDSTHFPAVFGGDAGGKDGHGYDIVGFNLRAEAGRAVIRERYAIDDKLRLVFRTAGMEDGVAFIEPAGL
jgi:hypothetical protein